MARSNPQSNVSNRSGTMATPTSSIYANPGVHLSICGNHSNFDVRPYVTTLGGDAHVRQAHWQGMKISDGGELKVGYPGNSGICWS
jgi:hypothetical protein